MQQFCNTCGAPITAGMNVCARCGTPVSGGAGAYDPTVRAGTPPGSAYGSQPYGPPPTDPYGAPPPPPGYGSQPPPGYGAPPPPPPGFGPPPQSVYGAPPPGFGGPQQVGYGGPQAPFMAPMPPQPKKSRTWLYVVLGIVVVVILACAGTVYAISRVATNAVNTLATTVATVGTSVATDTPTSNAPFQQTSTTGTHITKIQTGTGFDQNTGLVEGEKATFSTTDNIWVVYTVANPDPGATVTLTLNPGGQTANSPSLDNVTNEYANEITGLNPGIYTVTIAYNGNDEASINFQVTS